MNLVIYQFLKSNGNYYEIYRKYIEKTDLKDSQEICIEYIKKYYKDEFLNYLINEYKWLDNKNEELKDNVRELEEEVYNCDKSSDFDDLEKVLEKSNINLLISKINSEYDIDKIKELNRLFEKYNLNELKNL